jgi:hypothetical protein
MILQPPSMMSAATATATGQARRVVGSIGGYDFWARGEVAENG